MKSARIELLVDDESAELPAPLIRPSALLF